MQISQNKNIGFGSSPVRLPIARAEKILRKSCEEIEKANSPEEKLAAKKIYFKKLNNLFLVFKKMNTSITSPEEKTLLSYCTHEFNNINSVISSLFSNKYEIWKHFHKQEKNLINPFEPEPSAFDKSWKTFSGGMIKSIKRFQMFLDKDLISKKLSHNEIFKLALTSAKETLEGKNITVKVKNAHLLKKYPTSLYNYNSYLLFSNLIGNSAKYTPEGGKIEIRFFRQKHKEKPFLMMSIKDNGIGIPPEEHGEAIFGLRASNAEQSGIQGTGLGLNKVRKICENLCLNPIKIRSPLYPSAEERKGTKITCPIARIN